MADLAYHLHGTFIEACNCRLICPCWVDDTPDEDFCAGLFAWRFGDGSTIDGHDVSGRALVSVTVHGDARRGGASQSALYGDERLARPAFDALVRAFSGQGGGPLGLLAKVTGDVVDAAITHVELIEGDPWSLRVRSDASMLVSADGMPRRFDDADEPLVLSHTALAYEHGIGDDAVTAQDTNRLGVDVAALPGGPLEVTGRSGMTGRFQYHYGCAHPKGPGQTPWPRRPQDWDGMGAPGDEG